MHVVIIGNGISGITSARWIRKLSDHKITVISSESKYFFSRTALMYIYMGHMKVSDTQPYENSFWEKNRIDLLEDHVTKIDYSSQQLDLKSGDTIQYDRLILAVGSKSNKFGWPGQDLRGVRGLYSLQDLEEIEKYSEGLKRAVIVGGGLIGIELAEMFHSRHIPVTMLVREKNYWDNVLPVEEAKMITRHIRKHGIDLRLQSNLEEIIDDGKGCAGAVIVKETGERVECGFVGLTPGVSPNIAWLKEGSLETNRGILVDEYLQTNISNVYAIGDCAELKSPNEGRRGVEAVWYTGRMMGETCAYNICGKPTKYDPGIWFNSAKFIDIEYQVYGEILAEPREEHKTSYWEHESGEKGVRITYDAETMAVVGFNLMGIRFRHEVCEKWIQQQTHLKTVLTNLNMAFFDPELYESHEADIVSSISNQAGIEKPKSEKSSLNQILSFIKSRA